MHTPIRSLLILSAFLVFTSCEDLPDRDDPREDPEYVELEGRCGGNRIECYERDESTCESASCTFTTGCIGASSSCAAQTSFEECDNYDFLDCSWQLGCVGDAQFCFNIEGGRLFCEAEPGCKWEVDTY